MSSVSSSRTSFAVLRELKLLETEWVEELLTGVEVRLASCTFFVPLLPLFGVVSKSFKGNGWVWPSHCLAWHLILLQLQVTASFVLFFADFFLESSFLVLRCLPERLCVRQHVYYYVDSSKTNKQTNPPKILFKSTADKPKEAQKCHGLPFIVFCSV